MRTDIDIETLKETLTAQDWKAMGEYPYSASAIVCTALGISPPTFRQGGQFNACWLSSPEKGVFVLYDYREPIGAGNYAKVYKAISPQYPHLNLVLRVTPENPPHCHLFHFEGLLAHDAHQRHGSYSALLVRAEMDLAQYIKSKGSSKGLPATDEKTIWRVSINTTRALLYLHDQDTAHLDVKPPNFMYMKDGSIIMADPDMAERGIEGYLEYLKGTPRYLNRRIDILTKAELDQFALRRTLYLPAMFEVLYSVKGVKQLVPGMCERSNIPADSSVCWVIPDEFFNNRPYLKEILSAIYHEEAIYPDVAEILCALLLAKHNLFEIFEKKRFTINNKTRILPPELTTLIFNYYDSHPECELLTEPRIRLAIETIANDMTPEIIEGALEYLNTQLSSSSNSTPVNAEASTPPDENDTPPTQIATPLIANNFPGLRLFGLIRPEASTGNSNVVRFIPE